MAFNITDDISGVNFESAHFVSDKVNSATDCYNRTIYGYENSVQFPKEKFRISILTILNIFIYFLFNISKFILV